ncbi:unnamed protein product [Parajaminaea phylloscopi]
MPQSLYNIVSEIFPGKNPQWSPKQMPSQAGRVALVTGGYNGIGLETVHALLEHDIEKVFIVGRSKTKYDDAVQTLRQRGVLADGSDVVEFIECDLASLKSVRAAGEALQGRTSNLHMLFASAGVMIPPLGSRSADDIELQLATNVLGHHYLVRLALPLLKAAKTPQFSPRVCFTSSSGANLVIGKPAFSKQDPEQRARLHSWAPNDYKKFIQYGNSKLGNILQARKHNRLYASSTGIVFSCCNPGNLDTDLTRHVDTFASRTAVWIARSTILFPPKYGALNQLWACTSDAGERFGGAYVAPWTRLVSPCTEASDEQAQDELFEWCEEQVARVVGA